ncbi:hypothetical protein ACWKSP_22285 [Micromonosporaceae bacterium Da 78-11]
MTTSTLTEDQQRLRERVLDAGKPAFLTLREEQREGATAGDVAAVLEDLSPGAAKDYWR